MMKDYFTIHEFSKISGIETSTLRYWESIGLFSPISRNPENNYRYYSSAQLLALNFVTTLSDLDIPLKEIAGLRNERTPENLLRMLELKEKQLDLQLIKLREQSSIIHARQELIRYGMRVDENEIGVMKRGDMSLILWPRNEYKQDDTFIQPLTGLVGEAEEYGINLSFPVGGYWDDMESFKEKPDKPDHFFSVDPSGKHIRKEGNYLIGFSRGYYGVVGDLPERMMLYADENKITYSGPVYSFYLLEEISTSDPSNYLCQVIVSA